MTPGRDEAGNPLEFSNSPVAADISSSEASDHKKVDLPAAVIFITSGGSGIGVWDLVESLPETKGVRGILKTHTQKPPF